MGSETLNLNTHNYEIENQPNLLVSHNIMAQSAWTLEYTDYLSAEE